MRRRMPDMLVLFLFLMLCLNPAPAPAAPPVSGGQRPASSARQATDPGAVFLPSISTTAAETGASLTVLVETDTVGVTAAVVPNTCRVIVSYVDRAHGNLVHVAEHIGNTLVELPPPLAGSAYLAAAPSRGPPVPGFVPPGPKHAAGFPLFVCGRFRLYFDAREEGDGSGPFKLMVLDMPIPPPPAQ